MVRPGVPCLTRRFSRPGPPRGGSAATLASGGSARRAWSFDTAAENTDVQCDAARRLGGVVAARLPRLVPAGAALRPRHRGHDDSHPHGPWRGHPGPLAYQSRRGAIRAGGRLRRGRGHQRAGHLLRREGRGAPRPAHYGPRLHGPAGAVGRTRYRAGVIRTRSTTRTAAPLSYSIYSPVAVLIVF